MTDRKYVLFLFLFQLHYLPRRWILEVTVCVHVSSAVHWLEWHQNPFQNEKKIKKRYLDIIQHQAIYMPEKDSWYLKIKPTEESLKFRTAKAVDFPPPRPLPKKIKKRKRKEPMGYQPWGVLLWTLSLFEPPRILSGFSWQTS